MAIITGTASGDVIEGTINQDRIDGAAGDDTLFGTLGDDVLIGGPDADRLVGGHGNDTYYIDNAGDRIVEWAGPRSGTADRAIASVSFRLPYLVENLILTGIDPISGVGNRGANKIVGNAGDNLLDGRMGADLMEGGDGNDLYFVDNEDDKVVELAGNGVDEIRSSWIYYVMPPEVENIRLLVDALRAHGNDLDNVMIGNESQNGFMGADGNDVCHGRGGNDGLAGGDGDDRIIGGDGDDRLDGWTGRDVLRGGDGNDTLIGGTGSDRMLGGDGDDFYRVDESSDVVSEFRGGGNDRVVSSASYRLPAGVEELMVHLDGASAIGNDLDNYIRATGQDNIIDGGGGADLMYGGNGATVFHVDNPDDRVFSGSSIGDTIITSVSYTYAGYITIRLAGSADIDATIGGSYIGRIFGNRGDNVLTGSLYATKIYAGRGDDQLFGGVHVDLFRGGEGSDEFYFDNDGRADIMPDFSSPDDTIFLDQAAFTAIAIGALDADAFHIGAGAEDAADRIIYDRNTGWLSYDSDGSGAAEARHFATLTAGIELSAADFIGYGG